MIPADPLLLSANPGFEKLHAKLSRDVLDSDASTRARNIDAVVSRERLQCQRTEFVQDKILTAALFDVAHVNILPSELRELTHVIARYITDAARLGLGEKEDELLSDDVAEFRGNLTQIAKVVDKNLQDKHELLVEIASASHDAALSAKIPVLGSQPSSRAHLSNSKDLASHLSALTTHVINLRAQSLPASVTQAVDTLIILLSSQANHLNQLIRYLEQRKHGADARYLTTKATFLATVAQGLQAKTKVSYLEQQRDMYSPEVVARLEGKMKELEKEEGECEERIGVLRSVLEEYEQADGNGGEVLRVLGGRYREIEEEIERIKENCEKLEGKR